MGLPPWATSSSQLFVMVTGANRYAPLVGSSSTNWEYNSGLGLGFCERLVDEFLTTSTRDPKSHLILIVSTRSHLKTRLTITRLRSHLKHTADESEWAKTQKRKAAQAPGATYNWKEQAARVHFLGVEMDLCNLRSVYDAARKIKGENGGLGIPDMTTSEGLRRDDGRGIGLKNIRIPRLDVLVCNAGIGGFIGMDWPKAIFQVTTNLIQGTTWPTFKIARVGSMIPNDNGASSKPRTSGDSSQALLDASGGTREEKDGPVLAEVFTANLFGHYILGHELMPLLSSTEGKDNKDRGRMIFVSSIECAGLHFDLNDFQGIKTSHPYESSKRLTDILTLSAHLPSVRKYSVSYFHCPSSLSQPTPNGNTNPSEPQSRKPDLYLAHPGVCATEIANLPGILAFFMTLSFYLARLCGSIWHPIRSYAGACALTFLALTPSSFLYSKEGRHPDSGAGDKRVKWGSCTDRWGHERVRRTEVEGWGMSGVVGEVEEAEMVGRRPGARELSEEERVEFEVLGAECWREMERLRGIWERRLGEGGFRLKK